MGSARPKRRRCPHCRTLVRCNALGVIRAHTADCDGPGWPYDCPGPRVLGAFASRIPAASARALSYFLDGDGLGNAAVRAGITDEQMHAALRKRLRRST